MRSVYTVFISVFAILMFVPAVRAEVVVIDESFESTDWNTVWAGEWMQADDEAYDGVYSAKANYANDGTLTSPAVDTTNAAEVIVTFRFKKDDIEEDEFLLRVWDGFEYNKVADLELSGNDDEWVSYTETIANPHFFRNDFKIQFDAYKLDGNVLVGARERVWIDDVVVAIVPAAPQPAPGCEFSSERLAIAREVMLYKNDNWEIAVANYTDDIIYEEAIVRVQGKENMIIWLQNMFKTSKVDLRIVDETYAGDHYMCTWLMKMEITIVPYIYKANYEIEGASLLKFNADNKVYYHRDVYSDADILEKIPVLGYNTKAFRNIFRMMTQTGD